MCAQLVNPDSFQQGLSVFVASAADCDKCEVAKAFPLPENEIILDIYHSTPANWDGMSGLRIVTAEDIWRTMQLLEIPEELHCDYFNRVVFYHNKITEAQAKQMNPEASKNKGKGRE